MKRICVIGNSHAAALKTGWNTVAAEFPDVELTFFAAMSQHMEALELSGKKLVATTGALRKRLKLRSGGRAAIDNTYDDYVICGLGLSYQEARQIHEPLRKENGVAKLSADYYGAILPRATDEVLRNTVAIRILGMLRQITDAKILLIPHPLPAETDDAISNPLSEISGGMRPLLSVFQSTCERLAIESKAAFLPQPAETRAANRPATKAKYAIEPSRLDVRQSGVDHSHMNGEYGAIVLREVLGMLTNAPVRDVAR